MTDQATFDRAKQPYMLHNDEGGLQQKSSFFEKYAGPLTLLGGVCVHLVSFLE